MIEAHLPALQVVFPLASAVFCALLRRRVAALTFAIAVGWITFGLGLLLIGRVLDQGVLSYNLGGWAPPWGIEYRIDALGAFMVLIVSGIGAGVLSFAPAGLAREIPEERQHLFLSAYLLCMSGLLGICVTGDLFNVFVFLEISALSSYALISLGPSPRALTAAFHYLVLGTIGATFILIGIGLLYMMTGTLNMSDMALRLGAVHQTRTVLVAFAFFTVGVGLKMGLFPLHAWLPDAYTHAPSVVSAFLAGTATKVAVYILLRFVFTVFGAQFAFESMPLHAVLLPASLLAILVCSLVAVFQTNIKRMLAYSSLAQIGYIVLGISFASLDGLTAGITHLMNHAVTKAGMFLAMGCFFQRVGSVELAQLRGIGRRMPWTTLAWVVGGLSLIGVPTTAGFVSKWYLLQASLRAGWWPVALLILLSSLIALAYVWRFVEVAYFAEPADPSAENCEASPALLLPLWLLTATTLGLGLWTSLSVGVARRAAGTLLGLGE